MFVDNTLLFQPSVSNIFWLILFPPGVIRRFSRASCSNSANYHSKIFSHFHFQLLKTLQICRGRLHHIILPKSLYSIIVFILTGLLQHDTSLSESMAFTLQCFRPFAPWCVIVKTFSKVILCYQGHLQHISFLSRSFCHLVMEGTAVKQAAKCWVVRGVKYFWICSSVG